MSAPSQAATATNGGRERAIEALIDREPMGDFYRVSRVVDEAVPVAHAARPNLVTKSALVEQAFALQVYDVDTVAKYDKLIQGGSRGDASSSAGTETATTTTTKEPTKVDTLTKERIFHYQAKIAAAKHYATASSSSSSSKGDAASTAGAPDHGAKSGSSAGASEKLIVNPPASLVAALRHVYEEPVSPTDSAALSKLKVETSNALFELRHLLEAVSSHAVFPGGSSTDESSSGCSPATTAKQAQANLEKLIMNVLKQATDPTTGVDDDVSEATLQGLLIAILSVLTGQKQQPTSPPDMVNLEDDPKKRAKMASSEAEKKDTVSQQQLQPEQGEDIPSQSLLQVGALLSLLPIHEIAASSNDSATEPPKFDGGASSAAAAAAEDGSMGTDGHSLEPALLEYFGAAAAVYEERLEIQKARMLARLQTPPAPKKAPSEERSSSSPPPLLISRRDSDDDDDDDDSEDGANSIVETPTMSSRARNDRRRSIDPTGEEASTSRNTIESDMEEAALAVQNASDGDEEDEEAEEESCDSEADEEISEVDEDEEPHENNSDGLAESGDEDAHEEIVNSGDESSSASEDDDDSDEEAEMMDLDDAAGVDGYIDEEDEAVLQQALAMSMAAAAADSEGNDVSNVVPSVPAQAGEEVGNLPIPEDVVTSTNESAETPATRSVDDQQSVATAGEEDQDDASLPSFPRPPTTNPFSFQVGSSGAVPSNDPDALSEKAPLPLFSPSQLLEFSALPSSHVLFYLLRYTEMVVTHRLRAGAKTTSVVVGGMGTALFAAGGQGEELPKANTTTPTQSSAAKQDFTLQLLVASFLLMIEQRDDAIENMRKAVAREQRFARDGGFDSDDEGGDDNDSSSAPLSGEEDDPALTLAMNYVEDDVPLSSASLENKGMRRKAAAAAHDAAALLKSLKKRTAAWKNEVRLRSTFVACAMKLIRQFLRSVVRQSLSSGSDGSLSVLDFHAFLPSFVTCKLSDALDSLSSVSLHKEHKSVVGGEDATEFERLFQSLKLYRESILLWGEFVPLLFKTSDAYTELIKEMVNKCSVSKLSTPLVHIVSVDDLTVFPTTEDETQVHRLTILCRRLRIGDVLDCFVSKPIPYLAEALSESEDDGDSVSKLSGDPSYSSSLISFLGDVIDGIVGECAEVEYLYLSLCHRCHSRILLLDGFYATTETEADSPTSASSVAKPISTGDTVRVSANPSSSLQFDPTKMSDSIALLSGDTSGSPSATAASASSSSVHQRASKVWGAVLSTRQYSPKTGVHRWAIRLDKCERGHVFIGVATSQASTRTYVGGDKYGWGMIGTQALWHDRRKIRGDYGATFRTGSTIIVTLDTDAGTLSFSTWKDSAASSSFSVDPLVQNILSPKRSGQIGGTVDDWGIAFEGLPLDSKLYPAVGLYQRDDRVTLLSVENSGRAAGANRMADISGGECYFPRPDLSLPKTARSEYTAQIRNYNSLLTWDGVRYAAAALQHAVTVFRKDGADDSIVRRYLPSLGAALCLLPPSVPILSTRCALSLMPHINRCISELEKLRTQRQPGPCLFRQAFQEGKWIIRATGSSGAGFEEYIVDFSVIRNDSGSVIGIEGSGKGTSGTSTHSPVKITGCLKGSSLTFVEDWSEENGESSAALKNIVSCVVAARLSIDGGKFEGVYRNVSYESSGQIVGILSLEATGDLKMPCSVAASFETCEAVLCLAQSHLAIVLGDTTGDFEPETATLSSELLSRWQALNDILNGPLLSSRSAPTSSESSMPELQESLMQMYWPSMPADEVSGIRPDQALMNALDTTAKASRSSKIQTLLPVLSERVASWDEVLVAECGGRGSLRSLCADDYTESRRRIVCALLYHCGLVETIAEQTNPAEVSGGDKDRVQMIWRAALNIMECGLRKALSLVTAKDDSRSKRCTSLCNLYRQVSDFLLAVEMEDDEQCFLSVDAASSEFSRFYDTVSDKSDIDYLESEMVRASKRGILRLVSLCEIGKLASTINADSMTLIESLLVGLPRQFGRGKADSSASHRMSMNGQIVPRDLDGSYLSQLSGSCLGIKSALREQFLSLFQSLGRATDAMISQRSQQNASLEYISSNDSFLLSALAVFVGNMRHEDIDEIVSRSTVLSFLPKIFSAHRRAILRDTRENEVNILSFDSLEQVCQRDISRAILRCAVAAAHVLVYQAAQGSRLDGTDLKCSVPCVSSVLAELDTTISFIEHSSQRALSSSVAKRSVDEWEFWSNSELPEGASVASGKNQDVSLGLRFFRDHGTMLSIYGRSAAAKSSPTTRASSSGSSKKRTDGTNKLAAGFAHQFLSHWLHIVSALLRSPKSLTITTQDNKWLMLLMKGVGLAIEYGNDGSITDVHLRSSDGGVLPARFRARLLRLILPLLAKSDPGQAIVEGLLHLAGVPSCAVTQIPDNDEFLVSRESISLLRHLHMPVYGGWRKSINQTIRTIAAQSGDEPDFICKKIGILSFFSGSLETIGRGSFVLLKPASSAAVSPDYQNSPSRNAHPSGIAGNSASAPQVGVTPHHIVGNGTESVLAGLCRSDASAGIVSNVDLKNGICEVVLVSRSQIDPFGGDALGAGSTVPGMNSVGGRHSLSVRAVRAPVSDVVHAQEVPLFLDEYIPFEDITSTLLSASITSLLSSTTEGGKAAGALSNDCDDAKFVGHTVDLMTIRCCILLLSEPRILGAFRSRETSMDILSKLLNLAWPVETETTSSPSIIRAARNKSISSLPAHEARFTHLISLMKDLRFRMRIMQQTPGDEQERITNLRTRLQSARNVPDHAGTVPATSAETETGAGRPPSRSTSGGTHEVPRRSISQSTTGGSVSEDEEDNEAATTATAHLREAAIAQMAELGLPRSWSELALRRTGGVNIEAAVTFCLERGGEIERMLAEEREGTRHAQNEGPSSGLSRRRGNRDAGPSNHLLRQLLEMGFPRRWCTEALAVTGNNVDEALTWILSNGERLGEEDEAIGADEGELGEDESADEDEDETEVDDAASDTEADGTSVIEASAAVSSGDTSSIESRKFGWTGSVIPLRFISGRAIVNPAKMEISGLPSGGFSSVGTKGVLLTSGKWYYEAILETAGCLQLGWADGSFAGHCHADRGDGCGDGPSSWAFDGWRRYRWHATATEWGCRWKEGDVVGCLVDMDEKVVSFTLNGQGESIGMGVAFTGEGFRPCGGVYACVSFNRREKLRLILGGSGSEPFKHQPPPGYQGVGEAVLSAVQERESLTIKESILDTFTGPTGEERPKRFICDFSDSEHGHELMAWSHRYYGSDASVHLGSGTRSRLGSTKTSSSSSSPTVETKACATRRLEKVWSERARSDPLGDDVEYEKAISRIFEGYKEVEHGTALELVDEGIVIAILLCRKLLLHILVTEGRGFDPAYLISDKDDHVGACLKLWKVIEVCTSLRNAGWVGEAGAMAIAAEALGLGISGNDQMQVRSPWERTGVACFDDGIWLPSGGITQLLSSVLIPDFAVMQALDTSSLPASSAEAAMGSDGGGGILSFLQEGLQSAVCKSKDLRDVLVAVIRRSIRLLSVIEYDGDDFEAEEKGAEHVEDAGDRPSGSMTSAQGQKMEFSEEEFASLPDARLVAFLTGLLLSKPVQTATPCHDFGALQSDLVEAWSLGLLSTSLPWRMVCAFTVAGILSMNPKALPNALKSVPTLARYFGRLESTVARRLWSERAALPVCSRYAQSLVELLTSVQQSVSVSTDLPFEFCRFWGKLSVDAATPLPLSRSLEKPIPCLGKFWESDEGWISSDKGWEVWTGSVQYFPVDWKAPPRSSVRSLMDSGDGPPMLREGDTVVRGNDWKQEGNDDGKDIYDAEKAKRDKEKKLAQAQEKTVEKESPEKEKPSTVEDDKTSDPAKEPESEDTSLRDQSETAEEILSPSESNQDATDKDEQDTNKTEKKDASAQSKKKKKLPNPKLPTGTVLSIEPWNGIPGMGRRVRWNLTGVEGVYRFGGDGGKYDVCHVEVNSKGTRIKKKHPLPESSEQCASRHGFGAKRTYSVLLRLRVNGEKQIVENETDYIHEGILEWPDFGAGVRVKCTRHSDGAFTIEETQLLFGSKDSGWAARFGQPSFVPGSVYVLSPTRMSSPENQIELDMQSSTSSLYEELLGSTSFSVDVLRNPSDGSKLEVASEMRLFRARRPLVSSEEVPPTVQSPLPPPISFDRDYHASSMSLSRDGRTVSCTTSEGRGTAFASMGFTKGIHYWEVKLEHADIGSVFIGVAEKPTGSGSGSSYSHDSAPRLNRWHGWGFVNFRATFAAGAERVFGSHCHGGDTVGVLLDCDSGRLSYFYDGLKYGEHILNDLGCAFEHLSPFGFNVDGCGSGGAAQGAPSGFENGPSSRYPAQGTIRPRTLWPVIGLRNQGDRVTISSKWSTSFGTDGAITLGNIAAVNEVLCKYSAPLESLPTTEISFPQRFLEEAFSEYQRWKGDFWTRSVTRGSGAHRLTGASLDVDFDSSPLACASASALLGLDYALLAGDRVKLTRSAGRILELAEEAVVLGAYHGRLYYRIVSQKSEGGSLTEGGGRAWCWEENEVVDGMPFVLPSKGFGVSLPRLSRFTCLSQGGLRIKFDKGAFLRSDLEIFDGSTNLGTIPVDTVIPRKDVLDRRVNSCGVVRFRVRHEELGEGWISARIRGGSEEPIVEAVDKPLEGETEPIPPSFATPIECATVWYNEWRKVAQDEGCKASVDTQEFEIKNTEQFSRLVSQAVIPGLSVFMSDSLLVSAVNAISNFSARGDAVECPFNEVVSALSFALSIKKGDSDFCAGASVAADQAAATVLADLDELPPLQALLARVALLRSFNRRVRLALPWMSIRPCQEGSAILGGLCGHGASPDRAGRTHTVAGFQDQWVQVPSISTRVRSLRNLIFTSVKREFMQSLAEATTTPTLLSHDEYELPREIRTVRINRLKAARAMVGDDRSTKRKHCVFAQLHNETKNWGGAALRRGYVAKGHGGQKRAFKVKLIGEGVNDYSGPYREAFTDAIAEVLKTDGSSRGALGVLDPSPNNAASIGDNRDIFMFSLNGRQLDATISEPQTMHATASAEERIRRSFGSLMTPRDETSREVEEAVLFLGRIVGTAYRHGIAVDLPLPLGSVWKAMTEEPASFAEKLSELDFFAHQQLTSAAEADKSALLWWQQRMLNAFAEGISNVLPVEILPLMSGEEIRDTLCGNPDVDVGLLKQVVEYEGYDASDPVVEFFWETLNGMTNSERKLFLQFVWARNRLPMRASDFEAPFKIQKDSLNTGERADQALPSASTCFFSLTLPEYSSQDILREKLLFAINNVTTMETDFQTNSAEIAEGYRAF